MAAGAAEGVKRGRLVTDEPEKYPPATRFPPAPRPSPRRARPPCSASCARSRASPRSSTTRPARPRSAAAASAAPSRSRQARLHQRGGVRGLRRLRVQSNCIAVLPLETELRAQARDRPVGLQQGLLLREGLLPELRHRARRQAAQAARRGDAERLATAPPARAAVAAASRPALQHPGHRHRRHRRRHHRRAARHGRASRRQGLRCST
jgi:hypothetical protein